MHWDGSKAPLSSHHCPVPSRSPQRRPAPRVRTPTHPSRGRLVSSGNAVILVFYKWTQHRSILTSHFLCVSWGSILVCTDLVTSLTTVFCRISTVRFISLFSRQWMFWFIHHFLNRNSASGSGLVLCQRKRASVAWQEPVFSRTEVFQYHWSISKEPEYLESIVLIMKTKFILSFYSVLRIEMFTQEES